MAGFGVSALGTSPFGIGTPPAASSVPNGVTTFCRFLNPTTGEYEQDSTSLQQKQISRVMQQVLLALRTRRGSSTAVPDFGYDSPKKMGTRFAALVEARIRQALRHLTHTQKSMRITRISVTRSMTRYAAEIEYKNLETDETEQITVPAY